MANLKKGMSGPDVLALKHALYACGYLKVKPTHNRFGGDTEDAVKAFQSAQGLAVDGIAGPITLAALANPKPIGSIQRIDALAMIKKAGQMLDIIERRNGDMYVWGGQGHLPTDEYLERRHRDKPLYVTKDRLARFKKYAKENAKNPQGEPLRCSDCSGLFWQAENIVGLYTANDSTAAKLYSTYCNPIKKADLQPLDLVFSGSPITHVAVVGRGLKIHEAAGSEIGVVTNANVDIRKLKSIYGPKYGCSDYYTKTAWSKYGRLKIFDGIDLKDV